MNQTLPLSGDAWRFRGFLDGAWQREGAVMPDVVLDRRWHAARVPGSVVHDLWCAGEVPDPYTGSNMRALEWVPERTWVYRRTFCVPSSYRGQRLLLVFEGLDYEAHVFLNGEVLGSHHSQFVPARFEVSDKIIYGEANTLAVVLEPAPRLESQHGRTSRVRDHKTRMNYGWDFCPRLPHNGIWGEVTLETTGSARLEDVWVRPLLTDHVQAELRVELSISSLTALSWSITLRLYRQDEVVLETAEAYSLEAGSNTLQLELVLERPALWWPNGYGEQNLYRLEVLLGDSDRRSVTFGIRSLSWADNLTPDPDARPYTVVVNGHKIYLKGWNWVPLDVLYGVGRPQKLEHLLRLAARAHVNLLRVCGVGLIETRAFYSLCDRLGLMVWQEFIQSSSSIDRKPSSDAAYLERMQQEAEGIIPTRRNHPSLVLWCGGNELETLDFLPLDDHEPVLARLKETVAQSDPERLWLPTSATGSMPFCGINTATHKPFIMHDVHGPWHHQGLTGQYTLFNRSRALLHSELGAESLASLQVLGATLPEAHRWPAADDAVWEQRASSSWVRPESWAEAFGVITDLPTLVRATQVLQAEGVRYAVEANRRRKFENSGSLPWVFNEPYPVAAGTAAVDYYGRPKPVYHALARAYAPVSVTARFERQVWAQQESFEAEIWANNSYFHPLSVDVTARIMASKGQEILKKELNAELSENSARCLGSLEFPLGDVTTIFFLDLHLRSPEGEVHNRYLFSRTHSLEPLLTLPATTLELHLTGSSLTVVNTGQEAAPYIWLEDARPLQSPGYLYLSDNSFHLLPREERTVGLEWVDVPLERGRAAEGL